MFSFSKVANLKPATLLKTELHVQSSYFVEHFSVVSSTFCRWNYNLGQDIVDKFKKLSKIGFFMECLTADFSHFSGTAVKI